MIADTDGHRDDRVASLEIQLGKLARINASLMGRVERSTDLRGNAFSVFETAISLEGKVRERTADLERALGELAAFYALRPLLAMMPRVGQRRGGAPMATRHERDEEREDVESRRRFERDREPIEPANGRATTTHGGTLEDRR